MNKAQLEKLEVVAETVILVSLAENHFKCARGTLKLLKMVEKLAEAIDICSAEYELIGLKDTAFTKVQAALKEVYE